MFGLFDFNRDGETDAAELALGVSIAITIGGVNESEEEDTVALEDLEAELEELDAREPKRMGSEAYEAWADEHEELEDAMDEVRELLDEMGD